MQPLSTQRLGMVMKTRRSCANRFASSWSQPIRTRTRRGSLTVRRLKPGTFDQFRDAFLEPVAGGQLPEGFVRFEMVRNTDDPDEVICFGFFAGTVEELRASVEKFGYAAQQESIAPYVESVGADGLYEVVEEHVS
jgi:quinol monooxygenase YgiN